MGFISDHRCRICARAKFTQRGTDVRLKSGSDIGFRVERNGRNGVESTWMVRITGEWVPAEPVERVKY